MSNYPEVIADTPPALPHLTEVPWLMAVLNDPRYPWTEFDQDRMAAAFGGVLPHKRVAIRWSRYLQRCPKELFSGGPLRYRYLDNAPCRVHESAIDAKGLRIGRRLVEPGEVISIQHWKYENHSAWERVHDQPKKKKDKHAQHRAQA